MDDSGVWTFKDYEMKVGTCKILPHELAFDIDGVIADTFRAFVKTASERYNVEIEYEAITDYDFRKVIDIDEETSNEIIEMILDNPLGMGIKSDKWRCGGVNAPSQIVGRYVLLRQGATGTRSSNGLRRRWGLGMENYSS